MPHLKSLFRSLPFSTPTINYYDWLLGRPALKSWPDFTLHIDAVTGERRQARNVLERLEHAATALAASPSDGGLGLAAGKQVVGILSQNCLVRPKISFSWSSAPLTHCVTVKGIPGSRVCSFQDGRADSILSFAIHYSRDCRTLEAFRCHMLIRERAAVPPCRSRGQNDRLF